MTADPRVTAAREYLTAVRNYKVSAARPVSVLTRECSELRRQLGQVLDVIDGMGAEAAQPRRPRADGSIPATTMRPDGSAVLAPDDVPAVLSALDALGGADAAACRALARSLRGGAL